jgi:hypothetical protein
MSVDSKWLKQECINALYNMAVLMEKQDFPKERLDLIFEAIDHTNDLIEYLDCPLEG